MKVTIRDQFFELVGNRDTEWLEVTSTLLSLHEYFRDRASLLDRTANTKERIPIETIQSVLNELEHLKLITFWILIGLIVLFSALQSMTAIAMPTRIIFSHFIRKKSQSRLPKNRWKWRKHPCTVMHTAVSIVQGLYRSRKSVEVRLDRGG